MDFIYIYVKQCIFMNSLHDKHVYKYSHSPTQRQLEATISNGKVVRRHVHGFKQNYTNLSETGNSQWDQI